MENGIVKPMLRSLLISYVLSGILLAALAFALYKLRLKEGQVNLMVYAVYLLTCLCGGFLAGKRIRQRRFFWGLLSGLLYFLVLFAVSWAMNMGSAIDMERSVTVMGICALGGTIGDAQLMFKERIPDSSHGHGIRSFSLLFHQMPFAGPYFFLISFFFFTPASSRLPTACASTKTALPKNTNMSPRLNTTFLRDFHSMVK